MPIEGRTDDADDSALRWRDEALSATVRGLSRFWTVLTLWLLYLSRTEWAAIRYALVLSVAAAIWTVGVAHRDEASHRLRVLTLFAPLYSLGSVLLLSVGFVPGPVLVIALSVCVTAPFIARRWVLATLLTALLPYAIGAARVSRGWVPGGEDLGAYVLTSLAWNRSAVTMSVVFILVAVVVSRLVGELEKARAQERANIERTLVETEARQLSIEARQRVELDLIASHRMDTLGKLALGISHDYNNQLMVILGWVGLLEGPRKGRPGDATRGLDAISRAAEEGRRITAQLLAMVPSRLQNSEGSTNIQRALEDQLPMIRHLLPEDTRIDLLPGDELHALIAPGDFAQMALSFALDARVSMQAGDRLVISVSSESDPLESGNAGARVEIDFAHETIDRELPSSLRDFHRETGEDPLVNLASAVAIAERSGGGVRFDPSSAAGPRATIHLPAAKRSASRGSIESRPASLVGMTILIAEDDEVIRRLIGLALEKAGATVLAAGSGRRALELAQTSKEPIDLLCTDGIMPGMSTAECIRGVQAHHADLPVVVVSGYMPEELELRGARPNDFTFVAKPVHTEKLVSIIQRTIAERHAPGTTESVS